MKKLLIMATAFVLCSAHAFGEPRGWGVGLGTFEGDFGIQARKDFVLGKQQQYGIALQAGAYNQDKWTTRLDADFQYMFNPKPWLNLYPLAGVGLALQSKNNRAGFNLGAGVMVDLNSETKLFFELKHVFSDWDGFAFTAGIYF